MHMCVRLTVLASGSKGNCAIVASARTRLLVDAGLSCRETLKRMAAAGEDPHSLTAILISHEHSDHVAGLPVLARRLKIPVYMTGATNDTWGRQCGDKESHIDRLELFGSGRSFQIGDIHVTPFTIPHDAADPVAFAFRIDGVKLAIVTDLGYLPASVCDNIRDSDVLMVESNHDLEMLRIGRYPWSVKQRVMSRVGHLSNATLAEFLTSDYDGSAAFVVLAHLSEENNHPEIARDTAERALAPRRSLLQNRLMLASQWQAMEAIQL